MNIPFLLIGLYLICKGAIGLGKIMVKQFICCTSYAEAVEISKSYEKLRIKHYDLGRGQTIAFKRSIHKNTSKYYSHMLTVYFYLKCSDFCDYGYVDSESLKRYPELPHLLRAASDEKRLDIVHEYSEKSEEIYHELTYYENFDQYFRCRLQSLLNHIALAGTIALAGNSHTNSFGIYFEEQGQWYERGYSAYDTYTSFENDAAWSYQSKHYLKMVDVWQWMQLAQRKYHWDDQTISIPVTALSYVMNRTPAEQLVYAVIGLESIYVSSNQKQKKQRLMLLLPQVCPGISPEDVEQFYSLRSDLVHGDLPLPECKEPFYYFFDSTETKRCLIRSGVSLMMTIRALVEHNAFRIRNNGAGGIRYLQEKDI